MVLYLGSTQTITSTPGIYSAVLKIHMATTAIVTALNAESRASCGVSPTFWPLIAFPLSLEPLQPDLLAIAPACDLSCGFIYVKICNFLAFPFFTLAGNKL
jgi:hypothetical protein